MPRRPNADAAPAHGVRTLELFFDLVFVFAITQVSSVLAASPDLTGLGRTVALLGIIWWMYGGFAWLTNGLDVDRAGPRLLVLTAMAAFFVLSLAVPRSFDPGPWGVVLGVAYLVVVCLHTAGFWTTSGRPGIRRIGPPNLTSAVIVLVAGFLPAGARLWVILAAAVLEFGAPMVLDVVGFVIGAGHFVERHGLALIILLGESIIAVGTAATEQAQLGTVVFGALLALVVSTALWWLYFDREAPDSEQRLDALPQERRGRHALYSFGYAYLVMVIGITVAAVGMKKAITYFTEPLHGGPLWLMATGVAGYLVGLALFHRALVPGWPWPLLAGAVLVLLGVPAGLLAGWLMLAVVAAVLVGTVLARSRRN